jgi:hypothetical protein
MVSALSHVMSLPSYCFASDACLTGGGAHMAHDWFYTNWLLDYPEYSQSHINTLELLTVLLAIKRWGACLSGTHFIVRTDNKTAMAAWNKGSSRSREIMPIVREIFWLSVKFDFTLRAVFLPSEAFTPGRRRFSEYYTRSSGENLIQLLV